MPVERKINVFGVVNIPTPLPRDAKEDLDWFRYKSPKDNIDWYVPNIQIEVLSPDTIEYRVRGEAFLPKDWSHTWTLEREKIDISGPRRWGLQVRYSWSNPNRQSPSLIRPFSGLLRRFAPRNDSLKV